jgi:hypothetical protein
MTSESPPTLPDQVSRLYDLIAGYHVTHLMEIARELGVWAALVRTPGLGSEGLAGELGTDPFYTDVLCRTAFSFGLLEREGDGWRMAAHFDQILGDPGSSFYLACAPRVHMVLGEDYRDYVAHFRAGTTRPYQEHSQVFMREVAEALKTLPASSSTWCCRGCPPWPPGSRRAAGCWMWAAAAAGRWCRSPSGSRGPPVSGSTSSPTRSSWPSG